MSLVMTSRQPHPTGHVTGRTLLFLLVSLLLPLLVVLPTRSVASEPELWSYRGWTPSLSLSIGMMSTGKVEGSVRSVDSTGVEIRPPDTGEDFATTPIATASLGVDSPALENVFLTPSFFVRATAIATFPIDRNVASEGAVGPFEIPDALTFTAPAITGQGSQTEISTNLLAYSFSAGLSIPVELAGHRFRVRPGVSWMRWALDIRGDLHHAVKPAAFGSDFRAIDIHRHGKLYLNGIGPYLELESIEGTLALTRSIAVGFFAEAGVYRVLGDRRANLGLESSFDDAFGMETYTTQWSVEADEWFYRFGAGVRIYLSSGIGRSGTSR